MRQLFQKLFWALSLTLILINAYVFISGMQLAGEINYFEKQIHDFHKENLELEKKASNFKSYQYAASMAAKLDFVKKPTPIYIEGLKYAYR